MGFTNVAFDAFASFDSGIFDEVGEGSDLKVLFFVDSMASTMDSLHCKGREVCCYCFNCDVKDAGERDAPMMVMVGTARSA